MQSVSSRIWTRVAVSIFYDDNHYTTTTSIFMHSKKQFQVCVCVCVCVCVRARKLFLSFFLSFFCTFFVYHTDLVQAGVIFENQPPVRTSYSVPQVQRSSVSDIQEHPESVFICFTSSLADIFAKDQSFRNQSENKRITFIDKVKSQVISLQKDGPKIPLRIWFTIITDSKLVQSSHKMYSNNILNFQESTTILNACTKKGLETYWRSHVCIQKIWNWITHNGWYAIKPNQTKPNHIYLLYILKRIWH